MCGLVVTPLAWTIKSSGGQTTSPSCSKVDDQVGFHPVLDPVGSSESRGDLADVTMACEDNLTFLGPVSS